MTTTAYDALDRVTQVSFAGGISVTYDYDLGGRLVERTDPRGTTTYGYDTRNQLVAEHFLGALVAANTYDPYGVTTEVKAPGTDIVNPWRYVGQFQDDFTGLYKMGARYYQPELGRWTQPDPSGLEANAYLYVGGNPVNFVDPSGTLRTDCGIISCSVYTSTSEANRVNQVLSDPFANLSYSAAIGIACGALGGGAVCGLLYAVGLFIVADAFAEAARIGGCVRYTTGFGPNLGIEAIPSTSELCE